MSTCPRFRRYGALVWLPALLCLAFLGCQAGDQSLSPAAALFKKDIRGTVGRLSKVLIEPVCKADADSCEKAIASIYPEAPKDTQTFPFHVGVLSRDGILIYTIPPVKHIGDDYSQYQAVKDTLKGRRINNVRYYAPGGAELYLIMAPLMKGDQLVGLLVLRLDAATVQKKWGVSDKEFLAMDLN